MPAPPTPSPGRRAAGFSGVPPVTVDAAIAGAVAVAGLWSGLGWAHGGPGVAALVLGASVPLLWRRTAPVLTASVVCAATTGLALVHALPPLPYGALVAVYTVAALSARRERLLSSVAGAALLVVSLVLPGETPDSFGYVGMAFAAAWALGAGARARRAEIAALEERTRRLEEERAAAAAHERTRIARDMHDVLTHSVGIMVVQADAGSLVVRADPDRAEAAFDAIARTGREAVGQLRRVLGALRPGEGRGGDADDDGSVRGDGDGGGLAPAPGLGEVERLAGRFRRAGLEVAVESQGEAAPLPADVDTAAYRLVQESLTNTLRHAGATTARVRLRWSPGVLRIEVTDDGRGPDPAGVTAGYGLIGMRERVTACGGTLRAGAGRDEGSGGGFTVVATLPLGEETPPAVEEPSPPGGERPAAVTPPTGEERSADAARARRR
ncbi:sensor histidine kinase [Planomonospora venezuelensis]|uniref:histidine kinase n=1 Tax=Planomonospora venezuelensis TaxID=1999 RepID=A0A841CZX3_PLAVE|nr:sensor histidine kinase [Planomonospora venezuelensis]MBB5961537.1 signal transduction histidine kinase [Planomonospora venezuelensis]